MLLCFFLDSGVTAAGIMQFILFIYGTLFCILTKKLEEPPLYPHNNLNVLVRAVDAFPFMFTSSELIYIIGRNYCLLFILCSVFKVSEVIYITIEKGEPFCSWESPPEAAIFMTAPTTLSHKSKKRPQVKVLGEP